MVEKTAPSDAPPKKAAAPKATAPTTAASGAVADAPEPDAGAKQAQEREKRTVRAEIARRREALRQQEAERALPMQILLILFNSLGAAVVAVLLAGVVIRQLPSTNALAEPELTKLILVMSFLLSFLLTLLLLMRRLPENWWQLANEFATTQKYRAPDQKWGGVLATDPEDYVPLFDPTRKVSEVPPSLSGTDETPFAETPAPAPEAVDGEITEITEQPELFKAETKTEAQLTEEALAQAKAQAIAELDRFTTSLNETVKSAAHALDAASRFALQLYVAGACSAIARKFLLSAKDALALMVRALSNTGTGRLFAESFATNIEDYGRREVYRPIIMDGQNAMDRQLEGRAAEAGSVLAKFETWAKQADKSAVPRVVTFLFTDIVDAAALTERLGNLHAQRVVKAHDEAVNDAIAKNKGAAVKHTGDGIIATFPDPAKAVLAAQAIQQKLDAHNKRLPHLSTNVRISINAGEAVNENGEFFGATVKMTAQLCSMAKAGQILAADVVKSFCKSSQHAFNPFGEVTIAELDKVRAVFEVSWMRSGGGLEYSDIGQPTA